MADLYKSNAMVGTGRIEIWIDAISKSLSSNNIIIIIPSSFLLVPLDANYVESVN